MTTAAKSKPNIHWPAIHIPQLADELIVLESRSEQYQYFGEKLQLLMPNDQLVDSRGLLFHWENGTWCLVGDVWEWSWLEQCIKRHIAASEVCCISKLSLNTMQDAISAVKSTS